jgi:hypothetical protein
MPHLGKDARGCQGQMKREIYREGKTGEREGCHLFPLSKEGIKS